MACGIQMETFPYSSFPGHRVKTIVQLVQLCIVQIGVLVCWSNIQWDVVKCIRWTIKLIIL